MNEKKLYQQKKQAELDEWNAELDKLKAKASGESADAKLDLQKEIEVLEGKIEEDKTRIAELADASEGAWESIRDGVESAWGSMKTAFSDAAAKFEK